MWVLLSSWYRNPGAVIRLFTGKPADYPLKANTVSEAAVGSGEAVGEDITDLRSPMQCLCWRFRVYIQLAE
jgi:hypothetical protein